MKQYTQQPSLLALSPLFIFLGVYLVTSLIANDFYKVPITVAFVSYRHDPSSRSE